MKVYLPGSKLLFSAPGLLKSCDKNCNINFPLITDMGHLGAQHNSLFEQKTMIENITVKVH